MAHIQLAKERNKSKSAQERHQFDLREIHGTMPSQSCRLGISVLEFRHQVDIPKLVERNKNDG